jgi:hypothetical protein
MRWARFRDLLDVRSGIIAARHVVGTGRSFGGSGRSPVGAIRLGNNSALPGVVT